MSLLSSEEINLFHRQGYVLKHGSLTSEEMALLTAQVEAAINAALSHVVEGKLGQPSTQDQLTHFLDSRIVFRRNLDQTVSIVRINGCCGIQPGLLNTVRSDAIVHTMFTLLGTNDLEHMISQIHPKLSGDGVSYPKRRDIEPRQPFDPEWKDVLGDDTYCICIIPIDPMSDANGGLWVDRNYFPEYQEGLGEDRIWIEAPPGSIMFVHPKLFHGFGPNLSSASRRTLLTGFCVYSTNNRSNPGAHVNSRLQLSENGSISISPAPCSAGRIFPETRILGNNQIFIPKHLLSRVLYPNPVCLLTSCVGERRNVMTITWLTPTSNNREFVCSMNENRFSKELVLNAGRFVLNIPVAGFEKTILSIGGCSGRDCNKFEKFGLEICRPGWRPFESLFSGLAKANDKEELTLNKTRRKPTKVHLLT
jgi:ectoine hydroxylase-related dioxygenase (phytanoyl-CoA dioxygenase family)